MIISIQSICAHIEGMVTRDATIRVFGDSIVEITHGTRYVRISHNEDSCAEKPLFVAVYTRERLPKTAFYVEPWAPVASSVDEALRRVQGALMKEAG